MRNRIAIAILILSIAAPSVAFSTLLTNGNFETGDLTGWTQSGINGGFAEVVRNGTIFSAYDTSGIKLDGQFAINVRSVVVNPTASSVGILTSDPFRVGFQISFNALSENMD